MDSLSSSPACPIYSIIEKLSKKWSLLILRTLTNEKRLHFSDILARLPELNSRVLSERLSEFEQEGLINRIVTDSKPISITYVVTDKGMDLQRVFESFEAWGKKWGKKEARPRKKGR